MPPPRVGLLYFGNPAYAPSLRLDKKIADMTPVEQDTLIQASADVMRISVLVPTGVDHNTGHAILAAVYLKSLGRSPTNVLTEYEIDPRAFVHDLGKTLANWLDRVEEMSPDDAQGRSIVRQWKMAIGPLFLHPGNVQGICVIAKSWLDFNKAHADDRNRMAHHQP